MPENNIESNDAQQDFGVSPEEMEARSRMGERNGRYLYRPLDNLKDIDYTRLPTKEQKEVRESLNESMMSPLVTLGARIEQMVESVNAKRMFYSVQSDLERTTYARTRLEEEMFGIKEGENEAVLGLAIAELHREESAWKIVNWAVPYLARYFSGMEQLALVKDRNGQLSMSDMARFMNGLQQRWLDEELEGGHLQVKDVLETNERGETLTEQLSKYTAECYHWNQAIAEMNTYNPLHEGEKLNISVSTQEMLASLFKRRQRRTETGALEDGFDAQTQQITIYLGKNGKQIPQPEDPDAPPPHHDHKETVRINTLDYFNTLRFEEERRWIISAMSAMCITNAKERLDDLPHNIFSDDVSEEDQKKYVALYKEILKKAEEIFENYDVPRKRFLEHKIAKTAFYMSYVQAFGTMAVGDWGWNYGWKKEKTNDGRFIWKAEGEQGDPTASGDAFTAAKFLFHEWVYQAIKNRASAAIAGARMPLDPDKAEETVGIFLSETERINQSKEMLRRIEKGEQPHLAEMFGILGIHDKKLAGNSNWQQGAAVRRKLGMKINDNLKETLEETMFFIPTPFDGLVFPILTPQFKIALFDMMTIDKNVTVGELLRDTWKKKNGVWEKTSFENGGKRLTQKDVNWAQYHPDSDDGGAVDRNFMSMAFGHIYGPLDSRVLQDFIKNPVVAMTTIIKAVDICSRNQHKKLSSGNAINRRSFETEYVSSITFEYLALGQYNVLGEGGLRRFYNMIRRITPAEISSGDKENNLYTILRSVEDFIPEKQGYPDYMNSIYLLLLAQASAMRPIVEYAHKASKATTDKMKAQDTTGSRVWHDAYKSKMDG